MAEERTDGIDGVSKLVESAQPDVLRELLQTIVTQLMSAEADVLRGSGYGERSTERVNSRNGYRTRSWDTRMGTMALAIPKVRARTYFPSWLLEPRRRVERALVAVVTESYVLGVSTRTVEDLVQMLGIERLSKCRSRRCRSWRRAWTRRWRASASVRSMAGRTRGERLADRRQVGPCRDRHQMLPADRARGSRRRPDRARYPAARSTARRRSASRAPASAP